MATATKKPKIVGPKGFTTISLFHDSRASRKADRAWKVIVPVNENMTRRVRIDLHDGLDNTNGSGRFEDALAIATQIVTDLFGVTPEWDAHPSADGFGGYARWEF